VIYSALRIPTKGCQAELTGVAGDIPSHLNVPHRELNAGTVTHHSTNRYIYFCCFMRNKWMATTPRSRDWFRPTISGW